jgi:uncharacterized protein YegP (UPF0339 family)
MLSNGEIVTAGQGYETSATAKKGVEAANTHALNVEVEGLTETNSS